MKRKAVSGLCVICALLAGLIAAQTASAIGTTAFTCKEKPSPGGAGFSKAHCKPSDHVSSGAIFEHASIANGVETELGLSNGSTPLEPLPQAAFKTTVAGIEVEVVSSLVSGSGVGGNITPSEVVHEVVASGTLVFSSVVVSKPAGKCIVREKEGGSLGQVTTNTLKLRSPSEGMWLHFEPAAGEVFLEFFLEGASCPEALKGKKQIFGSINSTSIEGATINFLHLNTTGQGTLHFGSAKGATVGLNGSLTIAGRPQETSGAFTPLGFTTTGEGP